MTLAVTLRRTVTHTWFISTCILGNYKSEGMKLTQTWTQNKTVFILIKDFILVLVLLQRLIF